MAARPHQVNLNLAISDAGTTTKLVEFEDDLRDSTDANLLSQNGEGRNGEKSVEVGTITLAELCKMYPKAPKLMNVETAGQGLAVLKTNNWDDEKCVPEVISAGKTYNNDKSAEQEAFLKEKGYVLQIKPEDKSIFLHTDKKAFYETRYPL